jgi:hypothetical protein
MGKTKIDLFIEELSECEKFKSSKYDKFVDPFIHNIVKSILTNNVDSQK